MMYRVVIWGLGEEYNVYYNHIKLSELKGEMKVVGITDRIIHVIHDDYKFYVKEELKKISPDYIIVSSSKYEKNIIQEAIALGFDRAQLISARVFAIPRFNLQEYLTIRNSDISILSNSCWGGITYNYLGLRFNSPFINMFEFKDEYINFLADMKHVIGNEIEYIGHQFDPNTRIDHPLFKLGDMVLYMNHYHTKEEGWNKWHDRINRVNMNNLFVEMATDSEELALRFSKLPYERKICFVSFETDIPNTCYIPRFDDRKIGWRVSEYAYGRRFAYNVLTLLLYGRCM